MGEHKFLKKPPKRLAVVDQSSCTGCAGSPACVTFCETVTVKKEVVDAIRVVDSAQNPYELAVIEFDKCIGCALCAQVCPWDAITMYSHQEAEEIVSSLTLVPYKPQPAESKPAVKDGASPA